MKNKQLLNQFKTQLYDLTTKDGFMPYRDCGVARITAGYVFQVIYIEEHSFGEKFTIEIVSRPLYYPTDMLVLTPGNRLFKFAAKGQTDRWWDCSSLEKVRESFTEISGLITRYAIPFFDKTGSGKEIIKSRRRNIIGRSRFGKRVNWGTTERDLFETGHLFLWERDFKAARKYINQAYELFYMENTQWAKDTAGECLRILALIEKGPVFSATYLERTAENSRRTLALNNMAVYED